MEARRIRIEYDFSVTSRSTSVIDRIDTKTKNLNKNTNITRTSIQHLSRTVNQSTGSLNGMANATDRVARSSATATTRLKSFSNAMHDLSRNAGFAFRNLFSWRTMFLGFATSNVLGAAKRALIDYNVEMDTFRQTIALSLNQMTDWKRAFGGVNSAQERWNKSMIGSQVIMSNLRKHAASSIGTLKDYNEMFQLINAQVLAVGGNAGDTLDFAKLLVPITKSANRDNAVGAMDFTQALRGDPNLRNINLGVFRDPRIIALIKEARGNPKKGIAGKPHEAMQEMKRIMKESDTGINAFGKTYQAQMETMTDNFQVFAGKIGEPIFNRITKEMTIFNKNFAHTEASLQRSGTLFGKYLVDAFDKGREGLSKFYESLKLVGASIMSITQAMIALRVAGFAAGAASMIGGQSRNHIAMPSMPRMRTFNQPLVLPPISGPLAGAGRIHPAAAANGLHMGGGVSGLGGAAGAAAPAVAQIGMLRSVLGSTMLGFLGLGVAIAATTDRAKNLSKEHGYLGKMAKETVGVMSGLKSAFEMLANVAVGLVGSIAWAAKQITKVAAVLSGGRISTGRQFITKSNVEGIAKDHNTAKSQIENQNNSVSDLRARMNLLYSGGIADKVSNELQIWNILGGYKPGNKVGELIHRNNLEAAYREASKQAIKESGIAPKPYKEPSIDRFGQSNWVLGDPKNPKDHLITEFPMFAQAQAALIKEGKITKGQVKRTQEIINAEILRRQNYLDPALSATEEKIAMGFIGRQKSDEPPKFDFSGSTIIMNQDFRNSDPDRVFIKFAEDIGVVSANHIQSKLSSIVR